MYKVAICDDSQSYILYLKNLIIQMGVQNLEISEYTSGKQLLQNLSQMHDIIILDIQLGDSNGNQVAAKVRKVNKNAVLVLCSGVMQPTPMAFVVDAYRYLIKSDSDAKTKRVLKEIFDEADRRFARDFLLVTVENAQARVRIDDIMYISKIKYGSELHMDPRLPYFTGKQVTVKKHLDELYETMKSYGFEYAHSSYIVNCRWVRELQKDRVMLFNDESLPVSRNMRKRFAGSLAGSLAEKYH